MFFSVLVLQLLAFQPAFSLPLVGRGAEPDPSQAVSVKLDGKDGLVAFGLIPSNATESTGDTIGGIGSAIALKSFSDNGSGAFTGTLTVQPDRGFNVDGTIDYQGRQHAIDFVLSPYYGTSDLSSADAQKTLQLTYKSTVLYEDKNNTKTTGLDAAGVRPAQSGFPSVAAADPEMPIPSKSDNRLTLDLEGLVLNADGSAWVSDEYGPYIYRFSAEGDILQTIQPPAAIVPMDKGKVNFTGDSDPDTGRAGNHGFEGLTVNADGTALYALLQAATIQDGGDKKKNARYTRLLKYDISDPTNERPPLTGEWVVPLPLDSDKKTLAASELHFVSENTFLVLSRDGNGHGGDDAKVEYNKFDDPSNPVAKKGDLDKDVDPATYVGFVDYVDKTQLARFGLHNGKPDDQTLINAKWESLALAPASDPDFPDDYFLFTASDNDFISTQGIALGKPFNAGEDVDNQFLVFRVTLPGAQVNI
ncbi:hypothetical protein EWM64_g8824 [Hericium alpestre]|uniref:Phytase-like domain-containing protein n=1 Tax=Hericium alpestre TaxID=135208 RepID=A0A4Y9ZM75_9AGAM|nr:hypothetical protein EWM64_g8824 [Hericium alpestre]